MQLFMYLANLLHNIKCSFVVDLYSSHTELSRSQKRQKIEEFGCTPPKILTQPIVDFYKDKTEERIMKLKK